MAKSNVPPKLFVQLERLKIVSSTPICKRPNVVNENLGSPILKLATDSKSNQLEEKCSKSAEELITNKKNPEKASDDFHDGKEKHCMSAEKPITNNKDSVDQEQNVQKPNTNEKDLEISKQKGNKESPKEESYRFRSPTSSSCGDKMHRIVEVPVMDMFLCSSDEDDESIFTKRAVKKEQNQKLKSKTGKTVYSSENDGTQNSDTDKVRQGNSMNKESDKEDERKNRLKKEEARSKVSPDSKNAQNDSIAKQNETRKSDTITMQSKNLHIKQSNQKRSVTKTTQTLASKITETQTENKIVVDNVEIVETNEPVRDPSEISEELNNLNNSEIYIDVETLDIENDTLNGIETVKPAKTNQKSVVTHNKKNSFSAKTPKIKLVTMKINEHIPKNEKKDSTIKVSRAQNMAKSVKKDSQHVVGPMFTNNNEYDDREKTDLSERKSRQKSDLKAMDIIDQELTDIELEYVNKNEKRVNDIAELEITNDRPNKKSKYDLRKTRSIQKNQTYNEASETDSDSGEPEETNKKSKYELRKTRSIQKNQTYNEASETDSDSGEPEETLIKKVPNKKHNLSTTVNSLKSKLKTKQLIKQDHNNVDFESISKNNQNDIVELLLTNDNISQKNTKQNFQGKKGRTEFDDKNKEIQQQQSDINGQNSSPESTVRRSGRKRMLKRKYWQATPENESQSIIENVIAECVTKRQIKKREPHKLAIKKVISSKSRLTTSKPKWTPSKKLLTLSRSKLKTTPKELLNLFKSNKSAMSVDAVTFKELSANTNSHNSGISSKSEPIVPKKTAKKIFNPVMFENRSTDSRKSKISSESRPSIRKKIISRSADSDSDNNKSEREEQICLESGIGTGDSEIINNASKSMKRPKSAALSSVPSKKQNVDNKVPEFNFKDLAMSNKYEYGIHNMVKLQQKGKEVFMECFGTFPVELKPVEDSDLLIGASLRNLNHTIGFLEIKPGCIKKREYPNRYHMMFLILHGKARVIIDHSWKDLSIGDTFSIPNGIHYSVKNLSATSTILLHFVKFAVGSESCI